MATIKVFDSKGVRELECFDTLDEVNYLPMIDECEPESEPLEKSEE